jgi:PilZ domain-containing protein
MRNAVTKLDRADLRRQQRYMTPTFEVIVECEMFRSVDWSTGGIHLDGVCQGMAVGAAVEGWVTLPEVQQAFAFSGEVLRTDPATGNTVLRFDEIEAEVEELLDRALARHLH